MLVAYTILDLICLHALRYVHYTFCDFSFYMNFVLLDLPASHAHGHLNSMHVFSFLCRKSMQIYLRPFHCERKQANPDPHIEYKLLIIWFSLLAKYSVWFICFSYLCLCFLSSLTKRVSLWNVCMRFTDCHSGQAYELNNVRGLLKIFMT